MRTRQAAVAVLICILGALLCSAADEGVCIDDYVSSIEWELELREETANRGIGGGDGILRLKGHVADLCIDIHGSVPEQLWCDALDIQGFYRLS